MVAPSAPGARARSRFASATRISGCSRQRIADVSLPAARCYNFALDFTSVEPFPGGSMTLRPAHLFGLCALSLLCATPALAQADEAGRFSVAFAGGIVQTDIGNQPYWTASARFRAGY